MPIDREGKQRRIALQRLLALIGALGLIMLLYPHPEAREISSGLQWVICEEIGKALLVAAVLGFIVDGALKQDLIRDAVAAALGYLLPDPLKPELEWVYDQKFLVQQTFNVILEHDTEKNIVRFRGHMTRIVRNTSGEKAAFEVGGGTDEWFHPGGESKITKCEYKLDKDKEYTPIPFVKGIVGVHYKLNTISLEPNDTLHVSMAYTLNAYESGFEILTYGYPIENPLVTLDVPNTLKGRVVFSHRRVPVEDDPPISGTISRDVRGVLLPFQDIRIYWYLASDLDARRAALAAV